MQKIPKALIYLTAGLGLIVVVLLAFIAGHYLVPAQPLATNTNSNLNQNENQNNNTKLPVEYIDANTNQATADTNSTPAAVATEPTVTAGVTWLDTPETLDDLKFFTDEVPHYYYKVASLADGGSIIYSYYDEIGTVASHFREDKTGRVYLLSKYSVGSATDFLAATVSIDSTTDYPELDYPEQLTIDDQAMELYPLGAQGLTLTSNLTSDDAAGWVTLDTTTYGTVYEVPAPLETTYDNGSVQSKKYFLILADHSIVSYYDQIDFLQDDSTLAATWKSVYQDLATHSYIYGLVAGGCGVLGGDQYLVDATPEAFVQVATTASGDALYTVTDPDSTILKNAYESYKVGRDYEGSTIPVMSYDDFVAATPVLLWQDALGDYLIFLDNQYAPAVECGKPVVYLYPTQTTDVTVQVGADVRVSAPAYNDGWHVTAQPNGTLQMADGTVYPNLYWEGKGHGVYPAITFGRVVSRTQVGTAIRSDLVKQGFNAQEIKDFLEFWLPKMPVTPYVRLSWLNTQQMNQLAPLNISPRPDTVIRTFLDFAGQTTPETTLQPQTLAALPRNGFTVTEWGGLLLGQ